MVFVCFSLAFVAFMALGFLAFASCFFVFWRYAATIVQTKSIASLERIEGPAANQCL